MSQEYSDRIDRQAISAPTVVSSRFYANFGKRLLDIALVLLTAPVSIPVILLFAVAIRLEGGGPAFFVQDRVGQNGGIFSMLKLRTMVSDADNALERHLAANPEAREEWEHHQKLRDDPRITRAGRFLRATSLDELPQIWNILIGEMSLIGPRPMTPNQIDLYPGSAYYTVRPGLTGPWQVGDRNETSFAGRAAFDTAYARNISLRADLGLLCRTASVVVRKTGL